MTQIDHRADQQADRRLSATEMVESLTGFEEIAIEKHMGIDPYADAESKPMRLLRGLVFVQKCRQGLNAAEARKVAMDMPMGQLSDLFADEELEVDPESPVTPAGEGDAPSV